MEPFLVFYEIWVTVFLCFELYFDITYGVSFHTKIGMMNKNLPLLLKIQKFNPFRAILKM